jgi:hypothetical protein
MHGMEICINQFLRYCAIVGNEGCRKITVREKMFCKEKWGKESTSKT